MHQTLERVGRSEYSSLLKQSRGRWRVPAAALALAGSLLAWASPAAAGPPGVYLGEAYATDVVGDVGELAVRLGKTAFLPCPCQGPANGSAKNQLEQIGVSLGALRIGTGVALSVVKTFDEASYKSVKISSKISSVNLLGGLIRAKDIIVAANTRATARDIETNTKGTGFVDLVVAGTPISVDVAENTVIDLPGLGTLEINKVTHSEGANQAEVVVEGLRLTVTEENDFNLPLRAVIVVGHARSGFDRDIPPVITSGLATALQGSIKLSTLVRDTIGGVALAYRDCTETERGTDHNRAADVSLAGIIRVAGGSTAVTSESGDTQGFVRSSSSTGRVTLLGLISLDGVNVMAKETVRSGKVVREASMTAANLRVLGLAIPVNVLPNTRITLPGLGFVVLNEQIIPRGRSLDPTVVNAINVTVTSSNLLGLPIGSKIIVGHAEASASLSTETIASR